VDTFGNIVGVGRAAPTQSTPLVDASRPPARKNLENTDRNNLLAYQRVAVPRQLLGFEKSWGGQARVLPVAANPALTSLLQSRHVLQLQGPVGPFFDRMARWLQRCGARVQRVVFQGGDSFDCRHLEPIQFVGKPAAWPDFLRDLVIQQEIDCIVLFGQSREYHRAAIELAADLELPVVVLEEGYFRPGFVTMELGGVNGYSATLGKYQWVPVNANRWQQGAAASAQSIQPDASPKHFKKTAWHACKHYVALYNGRKQFSTYSHHRPTKLSYYASYWVRSWLRKYNQSRHDLSIQRKLFGGDAPFFFVPLQFDGDAQITQHSRYPENVHFIIEVMRSFATHAPETATLVFKQHPHARGGPGHTSLIYSLAEELGMSRRVLHLVEGDTPDLAEHAAGVVLINSTVGFQALERSAPLMVMGEAIYKQPHLTHNGTLDDFWATPVRPDHAAVESFLLQVKNLTQVPASVYANADEPLNWPVPDGTRSAG
jgi:capsular polysaccharide export protein